MHSIYKGTITHTRYSPQKHKFRYSTSMLFIDLENINKAFDKNIFCVVPTTENWKEITGMG